MPLHSSAQRPFYQTVFFIIKDASPIKDLQRQFNALVGDIETEATTEFYLALQQQYVMLQNSAADVGGQSVYQIGVELQEVLDRNSDGLHNTLYKVMLNTTLAGVGTVSQSLPYTMSSGVDWRMVNENAERFARYYSYDLVSGINDTTRQGLQQAITRYIQHGGRIRDLADDIRPIFKNEPATRLIESLFHVDRAEMIAVTEVTRAYARGKIEGYLGSGLAQQAPEKSPPAHPRCRCDVRPDSDELGIWWWIWLTANDSLVCKVCGPLHTRKVGMARNLPPPIETPPAPPEQQIGTFEQSIIGLNKERAAIYDRDGTFIFAKQGTAKKVLFARSDAPLMRGRVVTHNHPGGWSFSTGDVRALWGVEMYEMRAVGLNSEGEAWRYVLRPNKAFFQMAYDEIEGFIQAAEKEVSAVIGQRLMAGEMTREQANNLYWHTLWTEVEQQLGKQGVSLGYRREAFYGG